MFDKLSVHPRSDRGGLNKEHFVSFHLKVKTHYSMWSGDKMSLALNEPINGVNQLLEYRWTRKNWKLSTCNWLDLETLGHWLIMPKNSPRTLEWSDDFEFYLWNQPMQNGKIDQLPTKVPSTLLIDLHIQCNLGVLQILLGYLMHWPGHRPITALKSKTPLLNHQEQCCKSQKKKNWRTIGSQYLKLRSWSLSEDPVTTKWCVICAFMPESLFREYIE